MGIRAHVRIVAAVGTLAAFGSVPLAAPPAFATGTTTPTTYTWTGTAAASTTSPNPAWSDGANWANNASPTAGTPVNLDFPASACTAAGLTCNGLDDISGLVVDNITMGTPSASSTGTPPPGFSMSANPGVSITLDGGFTLTGGSTTNAAGSNYFGIPIALGANNSWSLTGPSFLGLGGDLSGPYSLQVAMGQNMNLTLDAASNEVGAVSFTGTNTSATLLNAVDNATVSVQSDLNGTDASPVGISNVALVSSGATLGPLTATGASLSGLTASQSGTGNGLTAMNGTLSLDSATAVDYQALSAPQNPPVAGTDYPEITATGAATLGDAQLNVLADCGMADNTTFTLLSAASESGSFDFANVEGAPVGYAPTGPIANNEVVPPQPFGNNCGTTSATTYLRINYTSNAVTATVVPQPTSTTTVTSSPANPEVNEPYQLVATVTPSPAGSAVPTGQVAFAVNGAPDSSCQQQPVQAVTTGGTTTYEATCDVAASGSPGSVAVTAFYTGNEILGSSSGSATVKIAPGTTSTSLGASTATPYEGQQVTYTATVAPAAPSASSPAAPTGNVAFYDGTTVIAACPSQPLGGTPLQATCQQTYTATGGHSITAKYLGDNNFSGSTSPSVQVTVQAPATSSTAVSFSPAPTSTSPVNGQDLTVIATVTSTPSPAGRVSFYANGATSPISAACTGVPLSASAPYTADCSTSLATGSNEPVSAVFTSSDPAVAGSTGTGSLTVYPAGTSTALAASPSSPVVGQPVTYTATVSVTPPGSGAPSGPYATVSFADGGTPISGCSAVALNGSTPDTASCTVTYDGTGSHDITATFGGVPTFNGSASTPIPVTVGLPPGTTSSQAGTSTTSGGSAQASDDQVSADAAGGKGTVTVSQYSSDPQGAPAFKASGNYFDVSLTSGSTFNSLTMSDCNLAGGNTLYWWDPASGSSGAWLPVQGDPGPTYSAGPPACISVTLTPTTSPSLSQMGGTVFTTGQPVAPSGYWMAVGDGAVFGFDAPFHGDTGGVSISAPVVGMTMDPCTGGYWLAAADGGVFSYDAPFYGSLGGVHLDKPIVGISTYVRYGTGGQPVRCGYRLVASDGGVLDFNAPFLGSMAGQPLAAGIVGIAADSSTGGYWLVASDGGVFSFDAPFHGSMGGHPLVKPVVGIAADSSTGGYWLVASDGGVFSFDAPFDGSKGATALDSPVVAVTGAGY